MLKSGPGRIGTGAIDTEPPAVSTSHLDPAHPVLLFPWGSKTSKVPRSGLRLSFVKVQVYPCPSCPQMLPLVSFNCPANLAYSHLRGKPSLRNCLDQIGPWAWQGGNSLDC